MSDHGGNVRQLAGLANVSVRDLLDFSASINPLGFPEWLPVVVAAALEEIRHYPDPDCTRFVEAVSTRYRVAPERVVAGNGSAELIAALPRVLGAAKAVIPVPTYTDYARAAGDAGLAVRSVALDEARGFAFDAERVAARLDGREVVFLGRPNNPTGVLYAAREVVDLAVRHPRSWFVVDEAFVEFVAGDLGPAESGSLIGANLPNVVVLRSLTKLFAIPGLRLGFAVCPTALAPALRKALVPWSVNVLAQAVGVAALGDVGHVETTQAYIAERRGQLAGMLGAVAQLRVFPGSANYLLVKIAKGRVDARELATRLLQRAVAIRVCGDFEGLDHTYFRVAVRTSEENSRLVQEIKTALGTVTP